MKKILFVLLPTLITFLTCCHPEQGKSGHTENRVYDEPFKLSREGLLDKIKGGWAGQVIGCTYGGPTEFGYCGTMIQDYVPIPWDETRMEWYFDHAPGLYDDIYMDLTFVDVIDKEGIEAPAASHAQAFANAGYMLWHANQAARYNILNGIGPPGSGYWENNPHADDIDFQIEADFAGLMSPGMVNSASEICDRVGHIMNYGDGWYGGVYVAAMYALAFVSDDICFVVEEGLNSIPQRSSFHQCISDVIQWHRDFPGDWKRTWFECERKWSADIGCPEGVFRPFNIDAKINAAYIVIGLLYGNGDFGKTVDISTRCGQDSDCNPASAGGILGTMLGYAGIPEYWKQGLEKVEDMDFRYTDISLKDVYEMSYRHALEGIRLNGGTVLDDEVVVRVQRPDPVKYEKCFEGHHPSSKTAVPEPDKRLSMDRTEYDFTFVGVGFVLTGRSESLPGYAGDVRYVPEIEVEIDGSLHEKAGLPIDYTRRRHDVCWKYSLPSGSHHVRIRWINPAANASIVLGNLLVYSGSPDGD